MAGAGPRETVLGSGPTEEVAMRPRNGERLPALTAVDESGATVTLPDVVEGRWAAVLIYRGHW